MTRRLTAVVAGLAAAAALALLPTAAASAHDYLVSSDPAADATVTTPPTAVTLTFNDRVLDYGSNTKLEVTDAQKQHYETGCATVADRTVSAPLALGPAGQYTVTYQIVSADGHTVSESYAFQYQPPAGTAEAAGSATTPCGAPPASETPAAETPAAQEPGGTMTTQATASTPQPTQTAGSTDLGLVIGIAVAIVVIAIAGVAILLITARRRPPTPPSSPAPPA